KARWIVDGNPPGIEADRLPRTELPPGPHTLEVSAPGFQRWAQTVTLSGAERKNIEVILQPLPSAAVGKTLVKRVFVNAPSAPSAQHASKAAAAAIDENSTSGWPGSK